VVPYGHGRSTRQTAGRRFWARLDCALDAEGRERALEHDDEELRRLTNQLLAESSSAARRYAAGADERAPYRAICARLAVYGPPSSIDALLSLGCEQPPLAGVHL
jgi:hypothetical protein